VEAPRVAFVGLHNAPCRSRAERKRIDDDDGQPGTGQRGHHGDFMAARRFQHDERRRPRDQPLAQGRQPRRVVRDPERSVRRDSVHIQVVLGDINADEE
jgi:hypothetical protein